MHSNILVLCGITLKNPKDPKRFNSSPKGPVEAVEDYLYIAKQQVGMAALRGHFALVRPQRSAQHATN